VKGEAVEAWVWMGVDGCGWVWMGVDGFEDEYEQQLGER
jgi:hypothetical protein